MNGFKRRRAQTSKSIRWAAGELFNKFGTGKVSVNDIARKAGVSPVTIYNHFESKEDLVRDWVTGVSDDFIKRLRKLSKVKEPYPEKLKIIIRSMLAMMEEYNLDHESEILADPELMPLWNSAFDEEVRFFMELIKEGKKQGYIGRAITNETIKVYFELIMQGMLASPELHSRLHKEPELMRGLLTLMLFGFYGENR